MRFIRKHRLKLFLLLCLPSVLSLILLYQAQISNSYDRETLSNHVQELIFKSNYGKFPAEGQACKVPKLEVNATEILKLLKEPIPVVCDKNRDWVDVVGSTAKIADWARKAHGNIKCTFTEVIRKSDNYQSYGRSTTTQTKFVMESTDVFKVHCVGRSGKTWSKVVTGIRSDPGIFDRTGWDKVSVNSLRLNVLMFGFDSMSHNMWKRKLPKTYNFATNDLKGIALNGYNIVGDGTPQALIPILTGKTELELPDTRKRMRSKASYVNVYPFIWNDFQKNGYATAFSEDEINIGTFTYRLKGFREQPVDHYTRPFYSEASSDFESGSHCYGGMSKFQIMVDFVKNMYEVYKDRPKFIFTFHVEYSHENNNLIQNADDDTYNWLKEFQEKGHLNNTLLILMSDHGSRFADIRNTQQGKLEERLPGFIFVFPSWFRKKYPEEMKNVRINSNRLTTPFDIYETLKNVVHFEGARHKDNFLPRGISLFKEIPPERTCRDALIEPHWCTCLSWKTVPTTDSKVREAVEHLVDYINSYTFKHRALCTELVLKEILWSVKLLPNDYLLKFKQNQDVDGFIGKMTDEMKVSIEIYQVKVALVPGNMLFEASIQYNVKEDRFSVSVADISRINKYRDMTHCIEDSNILHHLRKYCYCL